MHIVHYSADLAPFRGCVLVPTMGALHAAHASLIEHATRHNAAEKGVVVSIFVNPAQFNDPNDFSSYPRTFERDQALCERAGATCIYVPTVDDIYPPNSLNAPIKLPAIAIGLGLEDRFRPGHFEGVYRVVRRLFELTHPHAAVFGEKDWQQLLLARALVTREKMMIDIVGSPTVRDPDGLAMSSRNEHLSSETRESALGLSRAIAAACAESDVASAERAAWRTMVDHGVMPEYAAVRNAETLGPVQCDQPRETARVLVAGQVGGTRLLDNGAWN